MSARTQNGTAARAHTAEEAGKTSGALVCVRQAVAPWQSLFNLRSGQFADFLQRRRDQLERFGAIQEQLVAALHRMVPLAHSDGSRRYLLRAKRATYNGRPVVYEDSTNGGSLHELIDSYNAARTTLEADAARAQAEGEAECAARLDAIAKDDRFRLACQYASPDLWEDLTRGGPRRVPVLKSRDLGIWSYAVKLITKANPQHIFSELSFPKATGVCGEPGHEIVVNLNVLVGLERHLLATAVDDECVWLCMRAARRTPDGYEVWTCDHRRTKAYHIPNGPAVEAVFRFFEERRRESNRPVGTQRAWIQYACGSAHMSQRKAVSVIDHLVNRGVVLRYLITNFRELDARLTAGSHASEIAGRRSIRYHLATISTRELHDLARQVPDRWAPTGDASCYFVNSYRDYTGSAHEAVVDHVVPFLSAIKPCFAAYHNRSASERVIATLIAGCLSECGKASVHYLDLLKYCLRRESSGTALTRIDECPDAQGEWSALCAEHGALSDARVAELAMMAPKYGSEPSMCFVGPVDYAELRFFVSNVWAGNRRFIGRYRMKRRKATLAGPATSNEEAVRVELVAPAARNLNFTVPAFSVGCGFEGRYSHAFESWIDPSDVSVELIAERVVYRQTSIGRELRFHYRGFLLADYLPLHYQLLLVGNCDTFTNPFLGRATARLTDLVQRPALWYGPVCLRRRRWEIGREAWTHLRRCASHWQLGLELNRWLPAHTGVDQSLWYYRARYFDRERTKPRLLDLQNLASIAQFRRVIGADPPPDLLLFTVMEPGPDQFLERGGDRFFTELMIEV